jgi:recombination protein RecT
MSMQIQKQHPVENWLTSPENVQKMAMALPRHLSVERMQRIYLTVFKNNPALAQCSPASVIKAMLRSAELGLEPDGGKLYFIPRSNEVTVQIGYQGYIELARRTGQIASIEANLVYESDDFTIAYHLDSKFEHRPNLRRTADDKVLGVYAYAKLTTGERLFTWMAYADVEHVRRTSSGNSATWQKHWGEMAKKTVIKRAAKMWPSSTEMSLALETEDEADGFRGVEAPVVHHQVVTTAAIAGARLPAPPPPAVIEQSAEETEVQELAATAVAQAPIEDDEVPF